MTDSAQPRRFYAFGPFRLDPVSRLLFRDGKILPLAPKIIDTLLVLVEDRGNLVTKEELLKDVWPDTFVEESNLTHNISLLRKTLGESGYIETVPKRGYRFVAPVAEDGRARSVKRVGVATLILLLLAGAAAFYPRLISSGAPIRSLAVLPLRNLLGDPLQEYFVDGLTEALSADVASIRSIRVISHTSAMRYKATDRRAPEIARELMVDALLRGSVARYVDRVQIRVQLVRGSQGEPIWAASFEREGRDIPRLLKAAALAIAREIRAEVQPGERIRLGQARPVERPALEAYLRGRHLWNQRTGEGIQAAIAQFQTAIRADPAYAPAYASMADCYNRLGTVIVEEKPPPETRALATAAARKALEIDSELAEAHAALGYADLHSWNWERAEREFWKAIELNPGYAPARLWFAHYLVARGRFDEALQEVSFARDLDPLSPIVSAQRGWIFAFMRRYREAIAQYRKVPEAHPDYFWALWQTGTAYMLQSDYARAVEAFDKSIAMAGRNPFILGHLAMTHGMAGEKRKTRELLAELTGLAQTRYVSPLAFVFAHIGLEDYDRAFEFLEESYLERNNGLAYFAVWPGFDRLRSDPRGQQVLRRLGLEGVIPKGTASP